MKYLNTLSLAGLVSFVFSLAILVLPNFEVSVLNATGSEDQQTEISNNISLGYLGLKGNDLTGEHTLNFSQPIGFLVTNVLKDSPAEKANLMEKDVILEVDNNLVYNNSSLKSHLNNKKTNETLTLTILRDHRQLNISISPNISETEKDDYNFNLQRLYWDSYVDPNNNLILEYPSKFFTINNSTYDLDEYYANKSVHKISFIPNKSSDYNNRIFNFSIVVEPYTSEISPVDQNDGKIINDELNGLYVNFTEWNHNITKDIYDQSTYKLEYSYNDYNYASNGAVVYGKLFYTRFNDRAFTIKYEDTTRDDQEWLRLILEIIRSIKFFELKPLLDSEKGIYLEYPSIWHQTPSNEIEFELDRSSTLRLNFVTNDNFATNRKCNDYIDNNMTRIINDICDFLPYGKPYTLTFIGEYNYLVSYLSLIENVIDSIDMVNQSSSSDPLLNRFQKGAITHPFTINYNKTSWNWTESIVGYIGKTVIFQPIENPDVSLAISYYNENNFRMAEDERIDTDNNKPIYADERSSIQDNAANLNVKGLTGKTKLYFLYLDGASLYIQRIFYGKDNNDGNVKISYSGYYSDYLKYWPIAREMIESITLDDEIKQIESHGISVGESPSGILYDENDDIIFVVNQKSGSVSVINATNFQVIKFGKDEDINIENVSSEPFDLAYNRKYGSLYVVHNRVHPLTTECLSGAITKIQFNKLNEQISFNNITASTLINETRDFCPVDIVVNKDNVIFAADPFSNTLYKVRQEGKTAKPIVCSVSLASNQEQRCVNFSFSNRNQNLGLPSSGYGGIGLALDDATNKTYIANPNFAIIGGVQVFDNGKNEIEEGGISLSNPVACPIDITMDQELDRLYVVDTNNSCNFSLYVNGILVVIDSQTGEVMKDNIVIGQSPTNVIINHETHKIHVTNALSDSITVIDPLTFKPNTVNVGISPVGVTTNSKKGLIYTTSQGSNSVSMINEKTNKINHLITFKIEPSGSGIIKCEKNSSFIKVDKLEFVSDNTKCAAEPTKLSSFVFQSWSSDTGKDLRNEDNHANNPLFEFFGLGGTNSELPIKTSGTYTANFVQSQSLLTPEQLTGLYTLAAGIFSTWLIPSLTRWIYSGRKSRIQNNTFSGYLKEIQNLDKGVIQKKREEIIESLSKGKLSESQYHTLDEKLSKLDSNSKT